MAWKICWNPARDCGGSTPKRPGGDLWDYLSHRPEYQHLYRGTYMANYSWGELTIDELEH